jgi:adenylate cyclase class 2
VKPEIEAKFLAVDHDALRAKLRELDAECVQPMRVTKRKNYDFPDCRLDKEKSGWVRLRDSGDGKMTLAYKQLNNREFDGTHEVSVGIDNLEATDAFLQAIGLEQQNYQETKRESWMLDGCEVELDEWPWIKPFLEIEGPDEVAVKACAQKLGLDWSAVCHGSVEVAYQAEFDVTESEVDFMPVITFEEPIPEWLQQRRRA